MADIRTFKDFVEARYENALWDAVASFVSENPDKLECRSHSVTNPGEAELSDLHIKSVSVRDAGGSLITFDVLVETELELTENTRRSHETDGAMQWFKVSCSGNLEDGFHNFTIGDVAVYTGSRKLAPDGAMSGDLVPYIYAKRLESVAEDFLRRIYPEALERPMPLPVLKIAMQLGLSVQPEHLSKNMTVFGQIYFSDCDADCYDKVSGQYIKKSIKRGTLLFDPDVFFLRNAGCVNNTIIHECVHWDKHRKAFELQKLCKENLTTIRCRVVEGIKPEQERSPTDWMEWQACALAPRILMPYHQAQAKARELLQKHRQATSNAMAAMEETILKLAEFFGVSRTAAKIRMIDLGYEEAAGLFVYNDNHYVPAHSFAKDTLNKKQTFTVEAQDAVLQFAVNPKLRQLVDTGQYLYVDSHYCINDPKYIEANEQGFARLTEYANSHMDECCLSFDLEIAQNHHYGAHYYTECVLFKDAASQYSVEARYNHNEQNQKVEQNANTFCGDVAEAAQMLKAMPGDFSTALVLLMQLRGVSVQELADRCYMEEKTIQRMRTGKTVKPRSIVAVCVGLQLPPPVSYELLRKAGHSLVGKSEYLAFQQILATQYRNSILECNELMEASGFEPLSKI